MYLNTSSKFILIFTLLLFSCGEKENTNVDFFYKTEFFKRVQLSGIFDDSKTFVDCVPKKPLHEIIKEYQTLSAKKNDLKSFVLKNFELPPTKNVDFVSDTSKSMIEHIVNLWPTLTQNHKNHQSHSSLIPLPNSYVVPGGRFREIYYWDSYFTLLGLMLSEKEETAMNMVDNFSFLIDSLGFIPNGNRTYYLGRSQPPFFSLMVSLTASKDRDKFISYLENLVKEYNFWMSGAENLSIKNRDEARVVLMPDASILNRYWDEYDYPRPESYKPDYNLVKDHSLDPSSTYRHLRAGAESGWDYSSRWFKDQSTIATIHTTDIIPIDLNALMYHLEIMIAQGYNWNGQVDESKKFLLKAEKRKNAINKYLWDENIHFFVDYDYLENKPTGVLSLAGVYPLFFKIASKIQAKEVKNRLENQFLKPGGFLSTLNNTGQQWDSPNGWSPLQWLTINGLYNYGYFELGNTGARRWLKRNNEVYKATGKMMEKYNVVDVELSAGGGEYELQDGFGWTNGVAMALQKIMNDKRKINEMTTSN
ncbi:MAG: alpha,alpha-trehalase TreF [Cyclobacteriaceae bacterium]|nr:alpha,alpha-trehalase TreF [Cyclobacteriaceae bacterium]